MDPEDFEFGIASNCCLKNNVSLFEDSKNAERPGLA